MKQKVFFIFHFLLTAGGLGAQDHITIYNQQARARTVYDTVNENPVQRKKLEAFNTFRDSVFVLKTDSIADTSVFYRLRYIGQVRWKCPADRYSHLPDYKLCKSNAQLVEQNANDLLKDIYFVQSNKTYTYRQLATRINSTLTGFGGKYLLLTEHGPINPGSEHDFHTDMEYYLERVK